MKRTNLIFAASLLVFATFFAACEKSETTDPLLEMSEDDAEVSAVFDDVLIEVDETTFEATNNKSAAQFAMFVGSGEKNVTISFSGDTTIRNITFINFKRNDLAPVKNGVIVIKMLGHPRETGSKRIVLLKNFTVDGLLIEGRKEIIKTGAYAYSVTLTGGKVTFEDGTTYTREFTRINTWTDGFSTPLDIWDDVYAIEGEATGVNRKGNEYTHTITNAIIVKNSCRWIVEGTVELKVLHKIAVLDYGNGECDNEATITINGEAREIKLRGRR